MIEIKTKISCDNCNKFFKEDCILSYCLCCADKKELNAGEHVLNIIFEQLDFAGENIIGFSSAQEKKAYLKNVNEGILNAAFWVADFFGIVKKWEKFYESYSIKNIKPFFPDKK